MKIALLRLPGGQQIISETEQTVHMHGLFPVDYPAAIQVRNETSYLGIQIDMSTMARTQIIVGVYSMTNHPDSMYTNLNWKKRQQVLCLRYWKIGAVAKMQRAGRSIVWLHLRPPGLFLQ